MKNLTLTFFLLVHGGIAFAQLTLHEEHSLYRAGDHLIKQEVAFVPPGTAGENILWDFSQLDVSDDGYQVTYYEYPDSLVIGRERRSLYKYDMKEDTLFSTGIENPTTLIEYLRPELQLVFPVTYNDQHDDFYYGTGHYCTHIDLSISGKASYHADAYGKMLLPEGDTISNVLRVRHTRKQLEDQQIHYSFSIPDTLFSTTEIENRLLSDSLWSQTDTYRWYAAGYRYPVFETIEYYVYRYGNPSLEKTATFYYPPHEQYYGLENDPENSALRERVDYENEHKKQNKQKGNNSTEIEKNTPDLFTYTLTTEREAGILYIDYELSQPTEVSFLLTDIQGRTLVQYPKVNYSAGSYYEKIDLYEYPHGEYILRIEANTKVYGEKITY